MKPNLVIYLIYGVISIFVVLSCGSAPQPPPVPAEAVSHPAYLCVLCVDAKKIDILDLDQQGKFVKSIALPSTPHVMRISPFAANIAITDDTGAIKILANELTNAQKYTLDFAPSDVGFISHKYWLLSDTEKNQIVAFNIVNGQVVKTIVTPAGPGCYATKNTNNGALIYLACTKAKQLVEISSADQAIKRSLALPGTPGEMILDNVDNSHIYMTLPENGKAIRINLEKFAIDGSIDLVAGVRYLSANSTFDKLFLSLPPAQKGTNGSIAVIELPDFKRVLPDPITDSRLNDPQQLLVYDAVLDKPTLYVCNTAGNKLAQIDLNSYKITQMITVANGPSGLVFIPPL